MATAKQQATTKYGVTLLIEGSKLETVAKKIKQAVGDVKIIGGIEKIVVPGTGEWATEWVKMPTYSNPVLVNTDGRVIQRFEEYDDNDQPIEGKYAYYRTRDAYGKPIANASGKWSIESLEEAKSLVRTPLTQAEILDAADSVATHVVKYGASKDDSGRIEKAAESYLIGRGKEMPEEELEEDEDKRRTPEFIVTLRIKASTLPTVEKKAKAAFGDKLKSVKKVGRGFSRAAELAEAEEHFETVKEIVGELKDEMEDRRDNTPDSLQQTEKYAEVEECASKLESLLDELDAISFDVEFPGMY